MKGEIEMKFNWSLKLLLSLLFLAVILSGGPWSAPQPAKAATTNYSEVVTGIQIVPFHISGQYTTTTADVVQFQLPFKAEVLGISATARTVSDATLADESSITVDLAIGGSSPTWDDIAVLLTLRRTN